MLSHRIRLVTVRFGLLPLPQPQQLRHWLFATPLRRPLPSILCSTTCLSFPFHHVFLCPPDWSVGGRRKTMRTIRRDRKSTRLNSSHSQISYAVFCLKKKKR